MRMGVILFLLSFVGIGNSATQPTGVRDCLAWCDFSGKIHRDHIASQHLRPYMYTCNSTGLPNSIKNRLSETYRGNLGVCKGRIKIGLLRKTLSMMFAGGTVEINGTPSEDFLVQMGLVAPEGSSARSASAVVAKLIIGRLFSQELVSSEDIQFQQQLLDLYRRVLPGSLSALFLRRILLIYSSVKCVAIRQDGELLKIDQYLNQVIDGEGNAVDFVADIHPYDGDESQVVVGHNISVKLPNPLKINCFFLKLGSDPEPEKWQQLDEESETSFVTIYINQQREIASIYPVANCVYRNPKSNENATFCLHLAEELGIQDACVEQLRVLLESEPQ